MLPVYYQLASHPPENRFPKSTSLFLLSLPMTLHHLVPLSVHLPRMSKPFKIFLLLPTNYSVIALLSYFLNPYFIHYPWSEWIPKIYTTVLNGIRTYTLSFPSSSPTQSTEISLFPQFPHTFFSLPHSERSNTGFWILLHPYFLISGGHDLYCIYTILYQVQETEKKNLCNPVTQIHKPPNLIPSCP